MDRTTLTMLIDAYETETITDEAGKQSKRTVLRFHPKIAAGPGRDLSAGPQ